MILLDPVRVFLTCLVPPDSFRIKGCEQINKCKTFNVVVLRAFFVSLMIKKDYFQFFVFVLVMVNYNLL